MPDPKIPQDAPTDSDDEYGGELAKTFREIEDEIRVEDDPKPSALSQSKLPESERRSGRGPKLPR
jgi:hypothetical protein